MNCGKCGKVLGDNAGGRVTVRHAGRTITFDAVPIDVRCERCGNITRFNQPACPAPRLTEMEKVTK